MKLGLITDMHEKVDLLRSALDDLQRERVDLIVVIGDVFETGERIQETCDLLADAQVVGVWGKRCYLEEMKPRVSEEELSALRQRYWGDDHRT